MNMIALEKNILHECLTSRKPFAWEKRGLVFEPNIPSYTHGSHPCAIHFKDDIFVIAFACRDLAQRSHIFLSYASITGDHIQLVGSPKMALIPGKPGCFDCDGVIGVCFVKNKTDHYLYYVGWQNLPDGLWICDTGRALLDPENLSLTKEFLGPVLGRDKNNPLFAAAIAFHISNDGIWHTWYNSGLKWEKNENDSRLRPHYGLHYAHSDNGIDWICKPGLCIPFADEHEYAFGRPCVYYNHGVYFMWFAHRASKNIATYRIGFASSQDGRNWNRNDMLAGIDVSSKGWDSEMICYPYVFEHANHFYMLYNGNDYGKTGFGLAILREEI